MPVKNRSMYVATFILLCVILPIHAGGSLKKGVQYFTGESGWENTEKAQRQFKRAFDRGNVKGAVMYGLLMQNARRSSKENKNGKEIVRKWLPRLREEATSKDEYAKAVLAYALRRGNVKKRWNLLVGPAKKGIAFAQFQLAQIYRYNKQDERQRKATFYWMRRAAEQGHAQAAFCLGKYYEKGWGTTSDLAKAQQWYRRAFHRGCSPYGLWKQSKILSNKRRMIQLLQTGANKGDTAYQSTIARLYSEEPIHNYKVALRWYRKAYQNGARIGLPLFLIVKYRDKYEEAARYIRECLKRQERFYRTWSSRMQVLLGYLYVEGLGVSRDPRRALRLFTESKTSSGDVFLAYTGDLLGKDHKKRGAWRKRFIRLLNKEHNRSSAKLISIMYNHVGLRREETERILLPLVRRFSEKGDRSAMTLLAYLLRTSPRQSVKNLGKAIKWYRRAAEKGDVAAKLSLSQLFVSDHCGKKEKRQAKKWLKDIADPEDDDSEIRSHFARALLTYYELHSNENTGAKRSIRHLCTSDHVKYPPARLFLARLYSAGWEKVDKDPERARKLYQSVSSFYPQAAIKAAWYWNEGIGCDRNIYEAARMYKRAWVLGGSTEARKKLEQLREEYRQHQTPKEKK